jgi:hypothetical protein
VSGTVRFGEIADAWETDAKFRGEHQRIGPAMELAFALDEASALSPLRFVLA